APDARLNPLAQPAQPGPEVRRAVAGIESVDCGPRVDVLYYGPYFRKAGIARKLPLAWYVAVADLETRTVHEGFPEDPPPVVVALDTNRSALDPHLSAYRATEVELDPWVPREPYAPFTEAVVYRRDVTC
ncbi:MAG: hypothetical protein ABEI39_02240, partial [Halobacteriales archaeon]